MCSSPTGLTKFNLTYFCKIEKITSCSTFTSFISASCLSGSYVGSNAKSSPGVLKNSVIRRNSFIPIGGAFFLRETNCLIFALNLVSVPNRPKNYLCKNIYYRAKLLLKDSLLHHIKLQSTRR